MLSKNKIKFIRSLSVKKFRESEGLFLAEGKKLVLDLIEAGVFPTEVYALPEAESHLKNARIKNYEIVKRDEIERISNLKSPSEIVAVFPIPKTLFDWNDLPKGLFLVLDGIQDPGNLGTIIRLADWFGIRQIFCSPETADVYNPKTVQSTMGALARVNTSYLPLNILLEKARKMNIPVYGTFMQGENLYTSNLSATGLIMMGNEGSGIGPEPESFITHRITIPSFPANAQTSESLNVGVATAIVCAEFRRQLTCKG